MTYAADVLSKLSDAIRAVEKYREAREVFPRESAAAEDMMRRCYPERSDLITEIAKAWASGER